MQLYQDVLAKIRGTVNGWAKQIKQNNPKTKKYIDYADTPAGGQILSTSWFPVFEKGRGKRKSNTRSAPDETINGVSLSAFEARLYKWMQRTTGFKKKTPKGKANEAKGLRYLINKKGNKLYRQGGRKDVYSNVITDKAIKQLLSEVGDIAIKSDINDLLPK